MSVMPKTRHVIDTTTAENGEVSRQNGFAARTPRRNGSNWVMWLFSFFGAFGLLGIAWLAYTRYESEGAEGAGRVLTTPVKKGDLLITVTEDGNVESAKNIEIKCRVPGSNTILEIVPDGSHVKKGDLLVRLDSSSLEDAVLTQEIAVTKAEAAKISSEKTFSAAKIAVDEYQQGTFVQELQQFEADITVARQNLSSAENLLYYSQKMHRKGYVTQLDVESKEFAVEQAKLNMAVAERKKEVLEKFTRAKMLEDLISKRDSAEALMNSDIAAFTKESNQLKRLQDQLQDCTILAQQDGMVVYANDMGGGFRGGGQQGPKIDLGAQVNQFQAILRLPDLKNMQVKTLVHETKVDQLRIGMRARVKIQDREFQGEISSIANQPEPTSFWQGNTKEYATLIKIDGEPEELKPGMTAEVEILVAEKKDVLTIPVQCVVERGGKFHAYVRNGNSVQVRDLVLGGTNDTVIEVIDGLKEGEQVLLNPRADVPSSGDESQESEKVDVGKRFGAARPSATTPAGAGPAPGGPAPGGPSPAGAAAAAGPGASPGGPAAGGPGGPGGAGPGAAPGGPGSGDRGPGGPGGEGRGRGRGGPGGPGGFKPPTFKELDKDGDGKITREENPSPFFDRQDTNGDGVVDREEFKTSMDRFKKMMEERMKEGGGGPGGPGGGFGGPPGGPQ
ncbi:MAG TPA: HlyD family efflux transporter periplasmic adaptor subunit [Pirellulales bacterium]|nr:HlyD family efflux transporter periplasmic adaptor subunit [Pirellulales bacterium]